MVRQDPILIAGPPRSGTTMLAGLLHYHGVWVGRGRTTMYPGTNSMFASENVDIKAVFKDMAVEMGYKNWSVPFPDPMGFDQEQAKKRIESFVPEDTPWLIKTSWNLIFCGFLFDAYPDARWVLPIREPFKIVDSMNRHPGMRSHPNKQKYRFIGELTSRANDVVESGAKYTVVDVEKLVDKHPNTIGSLFAFLGIEPNFEVITEWIKPEMFRV